MDDLVAHADATVKGQVQRRRGTAAPAATGTGGAAMAATAPATFPLESAMHATYSGRNQQLALEKSFVKTPQTSLTMNGVVSRHSSVRLHLQANDLREVDAITELFRTPAPGQTSQPLGLAGAATFEGNAQGSIAEPHLTGQLTATNLQFKGSSWKVFRTAVDLSPSHLSLQHADLEPASQGHITFNASAGLNKWSFTESSPMQVQLNASLVDIADLTRLAGQQIPVTGTLSAAIAMHGTELNPVGNGSVTLANLTAYDQPVQSVKLM
jgi:translocation and assembly module TamB